MSRRADVAGLLVLLREFLEILDQVGDLALAVASQVDLVRSL